MNSPATRVAGSPFIPTVPTPILSHPVNIVSVTVAVWPAAVEWMR